MIAPCQEKSPSFFGGGHLWGYSTGLAAGFSEGGHSTGLCRLLRGGHSLWGGNSSPGGTRGSKQARSMVDLRPRRNLNDPAPKVGNKPQNQSWFSRMPGGAKASPSPQPEAAVPPPSLRLYTRNQGLTHLKKSVSWAGTCLEAEKLLQAWVFASLRVA